MQLEEHPTVQWYRNQTREAQIPVVQEKVDRDWMKDMCLQLGAADVGFVEIDRPGLAAQKDELLSVFPLTKTVMSLVFRLNRESLRTIEHSITNVEFKHSWEHANRTARHIVAELYDHGIRALNAPAGFPYNADHWPGTMWFTSDKINAIEAGVGHMGLNRLVLHPKFGSCVILGTILVATELTSYDSPLDYNPCIDCKLCASVCPTGAIASDGYFDFMSCYNHNYRERLGGFQSWVENVVKSSSVKEYRSRVTDSETISMWQNLSICPQTRCDRCMAVCPAGEGGIGEFLSDRKNYMNTIVKPMKDKEETIYVVPGSDAESHLAKRFPHKTAKRISNGIRPNSVASFVRALPLAFQRHRSEGLNATFHFTFTGNENITVTAVVRDKTITVKPGHVEKPDLHVIADSQTWASFLSKETSLPWALLSRKIRIKGSPKLMAAFAKCFPS
jgi:ferredoxin